MKEVADIISDILKKLVEQVRPGLSTWELDCVAEAEIKRHGVFSYNKHYWPKGTRYPYPAVSCLNVNNMIAHGIPRKTLKLKEGDLINIDLGIIDKNGNCGDAALTVPVGEISDRDEMLLRYAKKCLKNAIGVLHDGVHIYDIAHEIERTASERDFVVNRQLGGHAIGHDMHEDPFIYQATNHYHQDKEKYLAYQKYMDIELKEGQVICLEPLITFTDPWGVVDPDSGWTFITRDGKKSAMFEHMVKITKEGAEVLTSHISL